MDINEPGLTGVTNLKHGKDVTEEIIDLVYGVVVDRYRNSPPNWDSIWEIVQGTHLEDGTLLDLGSDYTSPVLRELKHRVMEELSTTYMSYAEHVVAAEEMSTAALDHYVQHVLGVIPPDIRSDWHVRVALVDTSIGQRVRLTWQRTECHVIEPWEIMETPRMLCEERKERIIDTIGSQIRDARCAAGYSQAALALRIGVGQQAVGNWERGRAVPKEPTLVQLRSILGVPLLPPEDGPAARKAAKYSRRPTATVYEEIRSRIDLGVYAPGDTLPAQGTMASRWGVNIASVQRAVRQLVDEGWLESRRGSSPVVRQG